MSSEQPRTWWSFGNGGWVRIDVEPRAGDIVTAYARLAQDDRGGRYHVGEIYFPPPLKPGALRTISVPEIESTINVDAEFQRRLERHRGFPSPQLETAALWFSTRISVSARIRQPSWAERMLLSQYEGSDEPTVRKLSSARPLIEAPSPPDVALDLPPEGTRPYPIEFFHAVADAYRGLVASGARAPAGDIADVNGVPVSTVHRWIRRARQLELLPPAEHGKRG